MKKAVIRAGIEVGLNEEASRVLASQGLQGEFPFAVRAPSAHVASGQHLRSMKRRAQRRDRALLAQGKLSGESVVAIRPDQVRGAILKWPGQDVPLNDF